MAKQKPGKSSTVVKVVKFVAPSDAGDIAQLYEDPMLGDGIASDEFLVVSTGIPKKKFIRVHPDPTYRRRVRAYFHKEGDEFGEEIYIVTPEMDKHLRADTQSVVLVTYVDRAGIPGIWPVKLPKDDGSDFAAWQSARMAAKACITEWCKVEWVKNAYKVRKAHEGYAAEPDLTKLPTPERLIDLALGQRIISSDRHPLYRDILGLPPLQQATVSETPTDDGDDGNDDVVA